MRLLPVDVSLSASMLHCLLLAFPVEPARSFRSLSHPAQLPPLAASPVSAFVSDYFASLSGVCDASLRRLLRRVLVVALFHSGHFDAAKRLLAECRGKETRGAAAEGASAEEVQPILSACMRHAAESVQHTQAMAELLHWGMDVARCEPDVSDLTFLLHLAQHQHRSLDAALAIVHLHQLSASTQRTTNTTFTSTMPTTTCAQPLPLFQPPAVAAEERAAHETFLRHSLSSLVRLALSEAMTAPPTPSPSSAHRLPTLRGAMGYVLSALDSLLSHDRRLLFAAVRGEMRQVAAVSWAEGEKGRQMPSAPAQPLSPSHPVLELLHFELHQRLRSEGWEKVEQPRPSSTPRLDSGRSSRSHRLATASISTPVTRPTGTAAAGSARLCSLHAKQ